jgi:STAS-like domain of unknown function (DUF4325)
VTSIDIQSTVGASCVDYQDGQTIYELIVPALRNNEVVALRFSGSEVFASPFFNSAIGPLLKDFASEDLNRLVRFVNLNERGKAMLRRVIANAKEYYGDPDRRKAMDSVLTIDPDDGSAT